MRIAIVKGDVLQWQWSKIKIPAHKLFILQKKNDKNSANCHYKIPAMLIIMTHTQQHELPGKSFEYNCKLGYTSLLTSDAAHNTTMCVWQVTFIFILT